jgi:hypothetical protein
MKVQQLIEMLQRYDPEADVQVTYDGMLQSLDVYKAADGCVLIDASDNFYKCDWQKTPCAVCGKQGRGTPFKSEPVCYDHWETYREETK